MVLGACSINSDKDIYFIRENLDKYNAETVPYEEEIQFKLITKDILEGIEKPNKITSAYDTDVYISDIKERKNELKNKQEIIINIGLVGNIEDQGTLLSTFRLNEDDTYSSSPNFKQDIRAFNKQGELGDFGGGIGGSEGRFKQGVVYIFNKDELMKSQEWTFEIEGLSLLKYQEK